MVLTPKAITDLDLMVQRYQEVRLLSRDEVRIDKEYVVNIADMRWREYANKVWYEDFLGSVEPSRYYTPGYDYEGI